MTAAQNARSQKFIEEIWEVFMRHGLAIVPDEEIGSDFFIEEVKFHHNGLLEDAVLAPSVARRLTTTDPRPS